MSYPNPLFSVFSGIGFIVVLIPFYWHLESWNTGTCLYIFWTALQCLNLFVNSIVWNGNAINWAPAWCDISTRIQVASSVAIPVASLCINRRLYCISQIQAVSTTKQERRRGVMIDLAIGLGIPILQMILQIVVQGHRYNIFEDFGCAADTYNTALAYPLTLVWPLVISLISAVYCALSIRAFLRRSVEFSQYLSSNSLNFNSSRYVRLMALAGTELSFGIPLSAYVLFLNATSSSLQPYVSWSYEHFDYGKVLQFPALVWQPNATVAAPLEMSRWSPVFCAFIFFGFFGFADEARKHYRMAYCSVARRLGYTVSTSTVSSAYGSGSKPYSSMTSSNTKTPTFPTIISERRIRQKKHDSLFTDSDKLDSESVVIEGLDMLGEDIKIRSITAHTPIPGPSPNLAPHFPSRPSRESRPLPALPVDAYSRNSDLYTSFNSDSRYSVSSNHTFGSQPPRVIDISAAPRHSIDIPASVRTASHLHTDNIV